MKWLQKKFSDEEVLAWLEWDLNGHQHLESFTDLDELTAQAQALEDQGLLVTVSGGQW